MGSDSKAHRLPHETPTASRNPHAVLISSARLPPLIIRRQTDHEANCYPANRLRASAVFLPHVVAARGLVPECRIDRYCAGSRVWGDWTSSSPQTVGDSTRSSLQLLPEATNQAKLEAMLDLQRFKAHNSAPYDSYCAAAPHSAYQRPTSAAYIPPSGACIWRSR